MQKIKSKKSLVALVLVAVLGIVGVTFAYFTSTDTFENVFGTKPYSMEVTETFTSPDNWTPGATTSKSVIATNKGDVDAAVRVSYTESWVDSNGDPLSLTDNATPTPNRAAIINFASDYTTKWTKSTEGGKDYYYYKTKLAKNASTSSLIQSVTFNPNVTISTSDTCTYTLNDDSTTTTKPADMTTVKSVTCRTTTNGYAGGTYTLTVKVETVQYDQYQTAWGTSVTIS